MRGPELTSQMRSRICELSTQGFSRRRIVTIHQLPLSTVSYTIKKEQQRVNCESLPRSGRPRALTEDQRDQVYYLVSFSGIEMSNRDLLDSVSNNCKLRSLQYLLREIDKRK